MKTKSSSVKKVVLSILLILSGVFVGLAAFPLFGFDFFRTMVGREKQVLEVTSPDGKFNAYVLEFPSFDPPNQSCFVERSDKTHFMNIADLAGDIDSIKEILWSPDSRIVVFHSHHYLTATRVSDWRTIRIYLGREWHRAKPQRYWTTFNSGGVKLRVKSISFPESGTFQYTFEDFNQPHTVHLDSVIQ